MSTIQRLPSLEKFLVGGFIEPENAVYLSEDTLRDLKEMEPSISPLLMVAHPQEKPFSTPRYPWHHKRLPAPYSRTVARCPKSWSLNLTQEQVNRKYPNRKLRSAFRHGVCPPPRKPGSNELLAKLDLIMEDDEEEGSDNGTVFYTCFPKKPKKTVMFRDHLADIQIFIPEEHEVDAKKDVNFNNKRTGDPVDNAADTPLSKKVRLAEEMQIIPSKKDVLLKRKNPPGLISGASTAAGFDKNIDPVFKYYRAHVVGQS